MRYLATASRQRHPLPRPRWFVVAVLIARVLAMLVAVQSSGMAHAAIDIVELYDDETHPDHDCSNDDDNHGCPPGCPSCHAACGFLAALPVDTDPGIAAEPTLVQVKPTRPREDTEPALGQRTAVFRPPRSNALA